MEVAHTAGLSPAQADIKAILNMDLLGTGFVLDEFGKIIEPNGAGVFIFSMSAYMLPVLPPEIEKQLAITASDDLLDLEFMAPESLGSPEMAYMYCKCANQLRVQAMSFSALGLVGRGDFVDNAASTHGTLCLTKSEAFSNYN